MDSKQEQPAPAPGRALECARSGIVIMTLWLPSAREQRQELRLRPPDAKVRPHDEYMSRVSPRSPLRRCHAVIRPRMTARRSPRATLVSGAGG